MRRVLLLAIAALALALSAPMLASADGRHHGHHGKHHKHKKAHRSVQPGPTAGTVTSFEDGVLTIALANGTSVSGAVTDDTEIGCVEVASPPPAPTAATARFGRHGWDDDHDWGDGHRRCGSWSDCDEADLVPGAVVWKARLDLGPEGAEFERVKLIVPAA